MQEAWGSGQTAPSGQPPESDSELSHLLVSRGCSKEVSDLGITGLEEASEKGGQE